MSFVEKHPALTSYTGLKILGVENSMPSWNL